MGTEVITKIRLNPAIFLDQTSLDSERSMAVIRSSFGVRTNTLNTILKLLNARLVYTLAYITRRSPTFGRLRTFTELYDAVGICLNRLQKYSFIR